MDLELAPQDLLQVTAAHRRTHCQMSVPLPSSHDLDAHAPGGPPDRRSPHARTPRTQAASLEAAFCCAPVGGAVPTKGTSMVAVSGITPSGRLTLGNYLGALRRFAGDAGEEPGFYFVADLHAMTTRHDPSGCARSPARPRCCCWPRAAGRAACSCSPRSRPTPSWPTCWSARRTSASSRGWCSSRRRAAAGR